MNRVRRPKNLVAQLRRWRQIARHRQVQVPVVSFVAWGAVGGRSVEIADALGGEARCFYPPHGRRRPPVALRYGLSALRTIGYLTKAMPDVVIVTNPPVFAGCVVLAWARVFEAGVVLDSHPGGFGAQGDTVSARLQPIHRWLVGRSDLVLVTTTEFVEIVEGWGGRALVVHEAPGRWELSPPRRHPRKRVLYVGRFASDEPVEALLEAAGQLPQYDFWVTGDPSRCPVPPSQVPDNVTLLGFLDADQYRQAVHRADVVVTLTTEPLSVMRAAYEAVYAGRPLVVSDWPVNRQLFPDAMHVGHPPKDLIDGIHSVCADYEVAMSKTGSARVRQVDRWEEQRLAVVDAIASAAHREVR